jgi:hypothetical protein
MKRIIIVAVVVAGICGATWAAYGVGYHSSADSTDRMIAIGE